MSTDAILIDVVQLKHQRRLKQFTYPKPQSPINPCNQSLPSHVSIIRGRSHWSRKPSLNKHKIIMVSKWQVRYSDRDASGTRQKEQSQLGLLGKILPCPLLLFSSITTHLGKVSFLRLVWYVGYCILRWVSDEAMEISNWASRDWQIWQRLLPNFLCQWVETGEVH